MSARARANARARAPIRAHRIAVARSLTAARAALPPRRSEIGMNTGIWPVQRNRTLFVTALVPVAGEVDTFRAWWGAADANIATGIVTVTSA